MLLFCFRLELFVTFGGLHKSGINRQEIKKMKIQEIRKIAKYWGIDTRVGRSKQELIRDIQIREGNEPCFQTRQECENDCLWKVDCIKK